MSYAQSQPPAPDEFVATQHAYNLAERNRSGRLVTDEVLTRLAACNLHIVNVYESVPTHMTAYTFNVGIRKLVDALAREFEGHNSDRQILATDDERAELIDTVCDSAPGVMVMVTIDMRTQRSVMFVDPRAYITFNDNHAFQIGWTSARGIHDRDFISKCDVYIACIGTTALMSRHMRRRLLSRDLRERVRHNRELVAFVCKAEDYEDDGGYDSTMYTVNISAVFPRTCRVINCEHMGRESPFVLAVVRTRMRTRTRVRQRHVHKKRSRPRLCAYLLHADLVITIRGWTYVRQYVKPYGRELVVGCDTNAIWLEPVAETGYPNGLPDERCIRKGKLLASACDYR